MNCEQRAELLLLLAAGSLDESAADDLLDHLDSGCPRCAGAWVEAQTTLAQMTLDLPPETPSPDVRSRLMQRVADDVRSDDDASPRSVSGGWWKLAAAAIVVAAATWLGVQQQVASRQADARARIEAQAAEIASLGESLEEARQLSARHAELEVTIDSQRTEIARLEREVADALERLEDGGAVDLLVARHREELAARDAAIADRDTTIERLRRETDAALQLARNLGSPSVDVVGLAGSGPAPTAAGRIFWDRDSRVWHVYAEGLPEPSPGRMYALWFITDNDRKVPAALFDVDPRGRAALVVPVPASLGSIALAAVTDEPIGGMPQPTGAIHLAGRVPVAGGP